VASAGERLRDALRAKNLNVHLIGRATKTKIELDQDYIDERLPVAGREMIYRQVENSFTQPNAAMNIQMLEWALDATKEATGDLLELYCGNFLAGPGAQLRSRTGNGNRQTVGRGSAVQHCG
jgi:tRNA (uracil-5-)-methyltransferase